MVTAMAKLVVRHLVWVGLSVVEEVDGERTKDKRVVVEVALVEHQAEKVLIAFAEDRLLMAVRCSGLFQVVENLDWELS
jgi:hypothetical protein